jgi:homoserine dehydrogenase
MKPIQVGLLGIGTVGSGTFNVLKRNQQEIQRRAGRGIEITMVADLDVARARSIVGPDVTVVNDARAVIANPEIDIVIELIGGYGIAKALVLEAIAAGKHVVTANKALLAVHGTEIFAAASAKGVMVAFEAAVAGGIPIIKALREGLTANRIQWIAGIINGTTNFILSEMRDKGLDFDVVLKEAQRLGYAEADPTFDIEGVDAAHKATIMSAIAFGIPVQFDKAYVEGITKLGATDIRYAEQLGYRIKLLGITKRTPTNRRRRAARAPQPGAVQAPDRQRRRRDERRGGAGRCRGHHAVLRQGCGQRAHRQRGDRRPGGHHPPAHGRSAEPRAAPGLPAPHAGPGHDDLPVLPMSEVVTSYYLRLRVADEAGVLAKVTGIVANAGISIDAVLQREADEVGGEGATSTDLIILTHDTREGTMDAAWPMQALPTVLAPIVRIRKEELN